MTQILGLNEALVTVNKSAVANPLDVYYQTIDCFGCPLDKIRTLVLKSEDLILSTKHEFRLEIRNELENSSTAAACTFNNLALNSHGHYRIDVGFVTHQLTTNETLVCSIKTIDDGDCLWCPMAILLCLIFVISIGEHIYTRFIGGRNQSRETTARNNNLDSNKNKNEIGQQQQQAPTGSENENATSHSSPVQSNGQVQIQTSANGQPVVHEISLSNDSTTATIISKQAISRRVDSLDAFRGIAISGMIFVNYGGAGYTAFQHRPWDGLTIADLVFPFFIFSMGASIAISTRSMLKRRKSFSNVLVKILRRSFILMALGLCLNSNWLNGKNLTDLRITGVLQRFSVSYMVVALVYAVELTTSKWIKAQSLSRIPLFSHIVGLLFEILTALNMLAIYLYVSLYFHYEPNCPTGYLGPGGQTEGGRYANCTGGAAAWLDRLVLGEQRIYNDKQLKLIFKTQLTHDPEGILGYTTSILLTLIGLQCGKILVRFREHKTRLLMFCQWMVALAVACVSVIVIPINKHLWSLTFVTLSSFIAYSIITALYLIIDVYKCRRTFFLRLLISAGKNAILLYVGHSLCSKMLPWYFAVDETSHLQLLLRLSWALLVWLLVAHYMAAKQLFVRI